MERQKKIVNPQKVPKNAFDSASLLFSIFAVVLISIGVYMILQNEMAVGVSQPGKYGQGGGTIEKIPGLFVILLGVFFAAFPAIDLIRFLKRRQ